jgi:hypothetical protein
VTACGGRPAGRLVEALEGVKRGPGGRRSAVVTVSDEIDHVIRRERQDRRDNEYRHGCLAAFDVQSIDVVKFSANRTRAVARFRE